MRKQKKIKAGPLLSSPFLVLWLGEVPSAEPENKDNDKDSHLYLSSFIARYSLAFSQ